jgi:cyclin B
MLMHLDFNVVNPSSYRFLERFSKIAGLSPRQFNLARYLIELPLIEYRMLKYIPSNLAASAVYLTLKILPKQDENEEKSPAWDERLQEHTGYSEGLLKPCAKDLCILLQGIEKCSLQAVRKKFSHPAFNEVALIRLEH